MMRKIIPYGRQSIDESDIAEVVEVLKGDFLTTGPYVEKFEKAFAEYTGAEYAVAVANGTAALHLACLAAGIGNGDFVITSPMTFAASANCVLYAGGTPLFADIDKKTYNIDPQKIEEKIKNNSNVKAIIPVHYAGLPADIKEINEIAKRYNLIVIEDACHALGAKYYNEKIGNCAFSDMAVFSFHPVKHITTGEGGMITTNNKDLYEKLCRLRTHGITKDITKMQHYDGPWYYEMQELGYNYRITDFQCALGYSQLKRVDEFIKRRREIADIYNKLFEQIDVITPVEPDNYFHSYHLYVLKIKPESNIKRIELFNELKQRDVLCQVHYIPLHLQPYYRERFKYASGDFPIAENHYESIISLPLYPALTDDEAKYVADTVSQIFGSI